MGELPLFCDNHPLLSTESLINRLSLSYFRLPLARLYASYFGGNLDLMTLHGHGTDVFVKLKKLDTSSASEI
jgi:hypothetical protein